MNERKIVNYFVIARKYATILGADVKLYIDEGYQPYGLPLLAENGSYQTMVKYDDQIMNKCDLCGKFRKYEELSYNELLDMDIGGNINHDEYLSCKSCIDKDKCNENQSPTTG